MKVLIGCEESGVLTSAFRAAGHEAMSCDLLPTRGNPDWHIRANVMDVMDGGYDLIILHPSCQYLAVSGNRWHHDSVKRHRAIAWTYDLWELAKMSALRVALENPVSVIFKYLNAPVCYVQPWEHGHPETKRTGFALHNLPPLQPSNIVDGREARVHRMPPGPNRSRDRSETYSGIAAAIVEQWG